MSLTHVCDLFFLTKIKKGMRIKKENDRTGVTWQKQILFTFENCFYKHWFYGFCLRFQGSCMTDMATLFASQSESVEKSAPVSF